MAATSKNIGLSILQTGVNPITGKTLSARERTELFKRTKVSGSKVFGKGGINVNIQGSLVNKPLEKRISILENQISFLGKSIENEAKEEKRLQRLYERRSVAGRELRSAGGEERRLESGIGKLVRPLKSPVEGGAQKAKGVLDTLKDFFFTIVGGWFTNQGLDAIKAYFEGDKDKLEEIKDEVVNTLAVLGGIFAAFNFGTILGAIAGITGIVLKIGGSILNLFKPKAPAPPPPQPSKSRPGGGNNRGGNNRGGGVRGGARGGGSGGSGLRSNASISRYSDSNLRAFHGKANIGDKARLAFRNTLNSKKFQSIKNILGSGFNKMKGVITKAPGFAFGLLKNTVGRIPGAAGKALSGTFGFLGNLFSKGGKGLFNFVGGVAGKLLGFVRIFFTVKEVIDRLNAGMTPAKALIPTLIKLGIMSAGTAIGASVGSVLPIAGTGLGFLAGTAAGGFIGDYAQKLLDENWKSSWDNLPGLKQLNQKGSEALGSLGLGAGGNTTPTPSPSPSSSPSSSETTSGGNTAKVASLNMGAPSLGPVNNDLEPEIVVQQTGDQGSQPLKTGSATQAPTIRSSNPENFYTLYSQVVYNVVS